MKPEFVKGEHRSDSADLETSNDSCQCEGEVQRSHEPSGENEVPDKRCKFVNSQ